MRSFPGDGSAHPADGVSPRPAAARTVRRDLRRILPILLIGILAAGFLNKSAGGLPGGDTVTTVVIVRHAEKDASGPNPRLTEAGRKRAARLARILADEPVSLLVSSDRARTTETLEPLAARTGLPLTIVPVGSGRDEHAKNLADTIRAHPGGTIVVSNHSDVIPLLLRELGVTGTISIPDTEYGKLFIIILGPGGSATVLRLRYDD
ncbi:MAG TPA: histidine phosphatase family protein [Bacteroidota bacterium]|nr:histidine phosphatase family protein [Bacteroidota bacterium]